MKELLKRLSIRRHSGSCVENVQVKTVFNAPLNSGSRRFCEQRQVDPRGAPVRRVLFSDCAVSVRAGAKLKDNAEAAGVEEAQSSERNNSLLSSERAAGTWLVEWWKMDRLRLLEVLHRRRRAHSRFALSWLTLWG